MGAADCTPSGRPCNPLDTSDPLYDAFRRSDRYGTLGRKPQPVLEYIRLAVLAAVLVPIKFVGALLCVLAFHIICRWAPMLAHTGRWCWYVLSFSSGKTPATAAEQHCCSCMNVSACVAALKLLPCFLCLELTLRTAILTIQVLSLLPLQSPNSLLQTLALFAPCHDPPRSFSWHACGGPYSSVAGRPFGRARARARLAEHTDPVRGRAGWRCSSRRTGASRWWASWGS